MTTPELALIQKLSEVRQALQAEREALLSRVAAIDEALAVGAAPTPKPATKGAHTKHTPRTGGIKESVLATLGSRPGLTIREVQEALSEHPAKSVENMVRALAAAGKLRKDESTPRKFSVPVAPSTNGKAPKVNGLTASA